jgi:hypothetical protein
MKARILAYALAAIVGMSSVADACHKGAHHGKAVKGKITSVGKNSLNLAVGGSAAGKTVTVNYSGSTAVSGAAHRAIDSSVVGDTATVEGTESGTAIEASQIAISPAHAEHGKLKV